MTIVKPTQEAIEAAATSLSNGGVIAFATETVYGLGCDTQNIEAVQKVYALKGRPLNNPMIAHILESSWAHNITEGWGESCENLAKAFWPGPLTIILNRKQVIPKEACGGFETIAVRSPSHPVAQGLLRAFGKPISAPSANISGYVSPTTAIHVEEEFNGEVTVLDGGQCPVGIESTVVSMVETPTILRRGSIQVDAIARIVGEVTESIGLEQNIAPGTSAKHYSPRTPTKLSRTSVLNSLNNPDAFAIVISASPRTSKKTLQMPSSPEEYATKLYASLREGDASGAVEIVIENPPNEEGWEAILDRLKRCCST